MLGRFGRYERLTTAQIAEELGMAPRTVRRLIQEWVEEGWLVVANASNRARAYELSAIYRPFIGQLSAKPQDE